MKADNPVQKHLVLILWLVAIHSFAVGCGLMFSPPSLLQFFGFGHYGEKFFPVQGGVFHIVMSVAYVLAAVGLQRYNGLLQLSILAKIMATIFLLSYYFFINPIWTVLASGIGDGLMGIVLFWAYRRFIKYK